MDLFCGLRHLFGNVLSSLYHFISCHFLAPAVHGRALGATRCVRHGTSWWHDWGQVHVRLQEQDIDAVGDVRLFRASQHSVRTVWQVPDLGLCAHNSWCRSKGGISRSWGLQVLHFPQHCEMGSPTVSGRLNSVTSHQLLLFVPQLLSHEHR